MSDGPSDLPRGAPAAGPDDAAAPSPETGGAHRDARDGDDRAPLSLDAFLPYRLSILAHTVSASFAAAYSEAFGISPPEWRIVSTLGEFRRMTATEIGNHSGMHKATISRAVLSLDKRQLLIRTPSTADRREEILALTAEGRRVYRTIAPMAVRYEQHLLAHLGRADIARLDRLIRHLMERASAPWRAPE